MDYLIGIDLGTSSVKTLLMDIAGNTISIGQENYDIDVPQMGWAEQSPDMWWKATKNALHHILKNIDTNKIRGIGFSGQMHGLVVLDQNGDVIRPSIIWADQRSTKQIEKIYEIVGKEELANQTLNPLATGFAIASLMWMKESEPENYARICTIMLPKDYIRFKLTGHMATESTDASSSLAFNTSERTWAYPLIDMLGIPRHIFPNCYESYEIAGEVTSEIEQETGLKKGTLVVYGGADQCMQGIGNGIIMPGVIGINIGTGGQVSSFLDKPIYDPQLRTNTFCHISSEGWNIQGSSLCSGLSLKWLMHNIFSENDFDKLVEEAEAIQTGSEGLIFLPYLTGERTPYFDPYAKGIFFGLTLKHTKAHLTRAVMEGVIYSLRDSLEILKYLNINAAKVIASGGGAKSKLWLQMQADIFNEKIYTTETKEEACVGAAIVAGVGVGIYKSIHEACDQIVNFSETVTEPIKENVEIYKYNYELYKKVYLNNKVLFRQ